MVHEGLAIFGQTTRWDQVQCILGFLGLHLTVCGVASHKDSSTDDCYVGERGFVSWEVSQKRVASQESQLKSFLSLLSNIFVSKDIYIWKPCLISVFSMKSSREVEDMHVDRPACLLVWRVLPPWLEAFCWLAVSKQVLIINIGGSVRLLEVISDLSPLCGRI